MQYICSLDSSRGVSDSACFSKALYKSVSGNMNDVISTGKMLIVAITINKYLTTEKAHNFTQLILICVSVL